MKKILLFFLALVPVITYAQNIGADSDAKNISGQRFNNQVQIPLYYCALVGNVKLRIDETIINCDSAVIDVRNSIISAYGNVIISPTEDLHLSSSFTSINFANHKAIGVGMQHYDWIYDLHH